MFTKSTSLTLTLIFLCHGVMLATGPDYTYEVQGGLRPQAPGEREW